MAMLFYVPGLARNIADRYKDLFAQSDIPYPLLCAYIAMHCCGISALSEFNRKAPWTRSVSTLSRKTINFDKHLLNRAMRRISWSVQKQVNKNPNEWILVIDTTANPKRIKDLPGRGLFGTSNNVIYDGRNLLVICAVNIRTGHALPIAWLPCQKRVEGIEHKTAFYLSLGLLDQLAAEGFPKLTLVADSWFDSFDFMNSLKYRGYTFVIQLKSSRKLRLSAAARKPKHSFTNVFSTLKRTGIRATGRDKNQTYQGWKGLKFAAQSTIWLSNPNTKNKFLKLNVAAIYNGPTERKAFGYYATNDLSAPNVWLWKMSRCRWSIEVMFRDLRQYMCFGDLASQHECGANLSIFIPFAILIYLRETRDEKETIGTSIKRELQIETTRSIDFLLKNQCNRLLEIYQNRNSLDSINKKPISSAAEKRKFVIKSKNLAA